MEFNLNWLCFWFEKNLRASGQEFSQGFSIHNWGQAWTVDEIKAPKSLNCF